MIKYVSCVAFLGLALAGCMDADAPLPTEPDELVVQAAYQGGPNPRPTIWADGEVFASIVTPSSFKPTSGPFDELYTCGPAGTFKDGIPLISESKPGDQDYNGGRWHVNVLMDGMPCDATADSVEDLDLSHFMSTDTYFACPVLPRRGNS